MLLWVAFEFERVDASAVPVAGGAECPAAPRSRARRDSAPTSENDDDDEAGGRFFVLLLSPLAAVADVEEVAENDCTAGGAAKAAAVGEVGASGAHVGMNGSSIPFPKRR